MSMMMLQILKSVDVTKTQKSRYLEKEKLFFLQIKVTHQGLIYCQKLFCSGGNLSINVLSIADNITKNVKNFIQKTLTKS